MMDRSKKRSRASILILQKIRHQHCNLDKVFFLNNNSIRARIPRRVVENETPLLNRKDHIRFGRLNARLLRPWKIFLVTPDSCAKGGKDQERKARKAERGRVEALMS